MAQSIRKQLERAEALKSKAVDAIYAFAPNRNTRFSDCWLLATEAAKDAHKAAETKVADLRYEALVQRKAYASTLGMLIWYR